MTRTSRWSLTTIRNETWWNGPGTTAISWHTTKCMRQAPPARSWNANLASKSRDSKAAPWAGTSKSAPRLSLTRSIFSSSLMDGKYDRLIPDYEGYRTRKTDRGEEAD